MRAVLLLLAPLAAFGQPFSQRGFVEFRSIGFPQTGVNDDARLIGEALVRWEGVWKPSGSWNVSASFDARADSHRQFEREARLDWRDRGLKRPALSLRRLSASYRRGAWNAEFGKQFIRWGKTDILTPTDRFAPRDFLNVVDNDLLGVTAGRILLEGRRDTLDLVAAPWFTPSRTPLLGQRWAVLPESLRQTPIQDLGARLPGRAQFGARWSRAAQGYDCSLLFYDGFQHLPLFDARLNESAGRLEFQRIYPRLRLYGGDVAVPLPWFTLKGEAAWFSSPAAQAADEYVLYVLQLERNAGEWVFVGGYAGQAVTEQRNPFGFAPDRGLARAFLGRASYTIDVRRSFAVEAAARQDGQGVWVKGEYSHLLGRHWRATASMAVIRGGAGDFLGQYRRNSHAMLTLRYSF